MSSKKQKYYVVWYGHHPGIYTSWDKTLIEVKNFPNAMYKSYDSLSEAEMAYRDGPQFKKASRIKKDKAEPDDKHGFIQESISVDAACSGNPGIMEYRGVWTSDKSEIFHFGPIKNGTNNIGEFLAIVHALALLLKRNDPITPIYTDSRTALSWIHHKKANTKIKFTKSDIELPNMIARAENWLRNNKWKNPILKWETKKWGEIPADFGRK
jgi:ribonuclease HI